MRAILGTTFALLAGLGCAPKAVDHPTWADVQPILAGECSHCHGSTADLTGDARTCSRAIPRASRGSVRDSADARRSASGGNWS